MDETTAERLLREEREAARDMVRKAAEPTTAEAFATVQTEWVEAISPTGSPSATRFTDALALLKRRIGAQEAALRKYRPLHPTGCSCSPCMEIDAALTDATPVFTPEEVETAFGPYMSKEVLAFVLRECLRR